MKKLLVLTLVLGIASLASATLSLADLTGGQYGVDVSDADPIQFYVMVESPGLTASNVVLTALGTGTQSYISGYGVMDSGGLGLAFGLVDIYEINTASATAGDIGAGVRATFDIAGEAGTIYLTDQSFALQDSITIVPEPATMALLGLGALVLRRKK